LRAVVRTVLIAGLALGLLAVFLRNADFPRVWIAMRSARAELLGLSLVLTALTYFIRAERWQYLLEPLGHTRFWVAFRTTVIGFAASFVLPARAGEVLRPYLLAKQEGLPPTAAFATIIVERMLDLVAVLILLCGFFLFFPGNAASAAPRLYRAVAIGGLVMAPVGIAILAAMFLMAGHPERLHRLVLRVERVLPTRIAHAVAAFARSFAEGLAVVRRPSRLVAAMAWSLVLWLSISAQIWTVARAFSIVVPFGGSFIVTAMLVVGVAIPTPGGVGGTHEAFRLGVTSFFGADNNAAVGAAILQHAVNFAPITVLGLWFLARDGINMGRLREMSAAARHDAPASSDETSSAAAHHESPASSGGT
jgi:glycosyltransferase 2 family protein